MGYGQNNQNQERQAFSLLELNNRVKGVILNAFPETCWVRAEMSDVRTNAASRWAWSHGRPCRVR